MSGDERETRLDALARNVAWLQEHDLDDHPIEAAKRLGLVKGDAIALARSLDDGRPDDDAGEQLPDHWSDLADGPITSRDGDVGGGRR